VITIPGSVSGAGAAEECPFSAFIDLRLHLEGGVGNGMRGSAG